MIDSIIDGVRQYIAECPLMTEFDDKHRHIDWTDADNDNYGIYPDVDSLIEEYIDGTQIRQSISQITVRRFAKLDADRLRNTEFMERLQAWFENAESLPLLPAGCAAQEITAANAMLSELDITGRKGTYTVQIILTYIKEDQL